MNTDYFIQKIRENFIQVIGCSSKNPLEKIKNLRKESIFSGFEGNVLFDLLLCNGYAVSNQYIQLDFINNRFVAESLRVIDLWKEIANGNRNKNIQEAVRLGFDFWKRNPEILKQGILTEKEILKVLAYVNLAAYMSS